ncbi:glyoxalase [Acrocarpospora phusangensis]|uniref:Glyoxalase n=1 Tax=Acrocarpospora phusangensis TaxID=1070424 RepID=A0A919QBS4_9ACTN|nr:VOC family protein [Acrocarpospora phusangensis]GIH26279.1 glyoxalase [Acrocarpospora phusangensis]
MLRGLATITFYADDLAAAVDWYVELLGTEPSYRRPGPDGRPAYVQFRIGDHQQELGILDRHFSPHIQLNGPGGAVAFWHVDNLDAAIERLLAMGAKEYEPKTERGEGYVTASAVDPFGNIVGVMHNPHYLAMLR